MKRIIFCLFSVLVLSLSTEAQEYVSTTKLKNQWRKQPIKVTDGGLTPDVVTLLKAFNDQYPTWAISEILKREPAIKDGDQWESTDDYRVLIDRTHGYADLASEMDIDQTEAFVWLKDNGHRIFAVRISQENDPTPSLLCWYDYDPQMQMMNPVKSPADTFRPYMSNAQLGYTLPDVIRRCLSSRFRIPVRSGRPRDKDYQRDRHRLDPLRLHQNGGSRSAHTLSGNLQER